MYKIIVIIVISLLLIAGIGYVAYKYSVSKPEPASLPTGGDGLQTPEPTVPNGGKPTPAPTTDRVKIFFAAPDDKGISGKEIGCGDSIVAVDRAIEPTATPLKDAIEELLSVKDQYIGQSGLYNALYQSNLSLESVSIMDNGKAVISLSGTYKLGGACDNPRFEAQIKETALQFPAVKEVVVFINGVALEDVLSGKGK